MTGLLERCRAHDADAWDEVVNTYERLIFSVAMRNGLDHEDANDVTQTVFLELYDSLHRIERDDSLKFWLMTVARRQAWKVRELRRRVLLVDEHHETAEIAADDTDQWTDVTSVKEALRVLGAPCRDLLYALFLDPSQPSYAEIAQRTGRTVGGIGPARGRCLDQIRQLA